ncbi:hypothetical protein [Streptacidiphilus albus]|uniref:hypothetical protein n=1 Tax=Streptacidiphilus albus TaxID=105425 RepID=UPI00054B7DE8|nr:hypothetical protein [Streptacidiphilus albus]
MTSRNTSTTGQGTDLYDFGLTGFAKYFGLPERHDQASTLALAARLGERYGPWLSNWLLADVRLLLDSPLPDETLRTLWLGAAEARFDPAGEGTGIRDWLEQLADVAGACRDRTFRISGEPADAGLREAVLAELDGVGPALAEAVVTSGYAAPLPDLVPALRRVVVEVDPDLGFRLLLRALKAYFMPISEVRYQRLLTLGERFGYHELAVDDGNLNTWPDLVD